jgi:SAM-dependent methyltransferase
VPTSQVPRFRESAVAHRFLDGLAGIEIGGSVHNPFHIAGCLNVDFTDRSAELAADQLRAYGEATQVDMVCLGDDLPFPDGWLDYVLSSHVLEHFYDPIGALQEWQRVVRSGGYLFMIIPHRDRTFDKERELTPIEELQERHSLRRLGQALDQPGDTREAHLSVWTTDSFLELCATLGLRVVHVDDVDDKVGNGFTVVIQR